MDLSFKGINSGADYKVQKPGQVAISSLLGMFSQLTNLGGLVRPKMQGSYSVDKEIAINQQYQQQLTQMSMNLLENSLRIMANSLQTDSQTDISTV